MSIRSEYNISPKNRYKLTEMTANYCNISILGLIRTYNQGSPRDDLFIPGSQFTSGNAKTTFEIFSSVHLFTEIDMLQSLKIDYPVPEFIEPVFTKTSPKRSFSLNRKRAFWLVFAKTGSIISGTG
jgi:hypothetical protein